VAFLRKYLFYAMCVILCITRPVLQLTFLGFFGTEYLQDFVTPLNIRVFKYLLCECSVVISFHMKYAHGRYCVVCIEVLYGPNSMGIESRKPQEIILYSKSSRTRQGPN